MAVNLWRYETLGGYVYSEEGSRFPQPPDLEGVWRPLADDQRRDRIVRAAEAWADAERGHHFGQLAELRAAVAAGRETT